MIKYHHTFFQMYFDTAISIYPYFAPTFTDFFLGVIKVYPSFYKAVISCFRHPYQFQYVHAFKVFFDPDI